MAKRAAVDREFERRGETLGDEARDGLLDLIGDAEVTVHCLPDEAAELDGDGIVEAEILAQALAILESGVLTDHLIDGIADKAEQQECEHRDGDHHEQRFKQAANGEGEHRWVLS